jgi:hypothetical protein
MIGEGAGELMAGRLVERRGQIDPGHLYAERGMKRGDPETRHDASSMRITSHAKSHRPSVATKVPQIASVW